MSVLDDFNRADGPVGSNWTDQLADAGTGCPLNVLSNQAAISVAGKAAAAFYNAAVFANDQWAQCRVFNSAGAWGQGPMVRSSGSLSTTFTNYEAFAQSATNLRFARHINGTPLTLKNIPATIVDGDLILVQVVGTVLLMAQKTGVGDLTYRGSVIDTTVTVGSGGVILHAGGPVDDFEADSGVHPFFVRYLQPFFGRMTSRLRLA